MDSLGKELVHKTEGSTPHWRKYIGSHFDIQIYTNGSVLMNRTINVWIFIIKQMLLVRIIVGVTGLNSAMFRNIK